MNNERLYFSVPCSLFDIPVFNFLVRLFLVPCSIFLYSTSLFVCSLFLVRYSCIQLPCSSVPCSLFDILASIIFYKHLAPSEHQKFFIYYLQIGSPFGALEIFIYSLLSFIYHPLNYHLSSNQLSSTNSSPPGQSPSSPGTHLFLKNACNLKTL